jgi:glycosyltransferase involved in cell wall biosynthesis
MAGGLIADGHSVTVAGIGTTDSEHTENGVRVITLRAYHFPKLAWCLNRRMLETFFESEVRSGRIDLIEVPDFEGWMPFYYRACPVVVRLHLSATTIALHAGIRPRRGVRWCEGRTLGQNRSWIGVSRHSLELTRLTFSARPVRDTVVYYPSVLPDPADSLFDHCFKFDYILFAGALSKRKGVMKLAEAARTFLPRLPGVHLVFVGPSVVENGHSSEWHIRQVVGPDLVDRVHFTGRVSRSAVVRLMRRARSFVFPSTLETLGLVVTEAMLCGCPVVTSNAPPFNEFLIDGENAVLVNDTDPKTLAKRIVDLLNDSKRAAAIARKALSTARECFSVASCVRDSLQFYRECSR